MQAEEDLNTLFIKDLLEFEANGFRFDDHTRFFNLGKPSEILLNCGVANSPIVITQSVINKAIGNDPRKKDISHQLTVKELWSIPEHIQNPIAIIESLTQKLAIIFITETRDKKGETVIAALHGNKMLPGKIIVNAVASIHTRTDKSIYDLLVIANAKGELLHINQLKIKNWLNRVGQPQLLPKLISQF